MPFLLTLRSTETIQLDDPAVDSLPEFHAAVEAMVPEGYELVNPIRGQLSAQSTRTDEITVESLDDYESKVPDGWQILTIRET